eukprot:GILJ01002565.1.p1 GENE.GILJ01002565.1~~GILJ01002565.1.p1  ORF type:complete len:157 (-),score=23.51 GILJ01002565.1:84-524(-)
MAVSCTADNFASTLRILTILCSIALIIVGIFCFILCGVTDPLNFIMAAYQIIFGVAIFGAEFKIGKILQLFPFLVGYGGKGMFYIFVGTICFTKNWWQIVMGAVMVANGFLYLFFSCGMCGGPARMSTQQGTGTVAKTTVSAGSAV